MARVFCIPDLPPMPWVTLSGLHKPPLTATPPYSPGFQGYKPESQFPSLHPHPLPDASEGPLGSSPDVPPACPLPCVSPIATLGQSPASCLEVHTSCPAGLPAAALTLAVTSLRTTGRALRVQSSLLSAPNPSVTRVIMVTTQQALS